MRKTCLDSIYELAKRDERVVFVGSDLGPGVLADMKREMPERFFMEGVSEAHLIGMAAGLAMEGFIPYVNTIATFLTRRCLEQIALDLCLHNLPVRLIANGGGLVYAPLGPTHLAVEDISLLRCLPNMTITAPCDAEEMKRLVPATLDVPGPLYIRLGRGGDRVVSEARHGFSLGRAILLRPHGELTLITTGVMAQRCLDVAELLAARGVSCGVLHLPTLKPLDVEALGEAAQKSAKLVSVEEHTRVGGLGSAIAEWIVDAEPLPRPRLLRIGLPDAFAHDYGRQDDLLQVMGLQPEPILQQILGRWELGS